MSSAWHNIFRKYSRGFTLIELLIVITIIAILSVVAATVYSGIQKNARDARRKDDINAISHAMEANYGKTTPGQYAALATSMFSQGTVPLDPSDSNPSGIGVTVIDGKCPTVCKYCYKEGITAQTAAACTAGGNFLTSNAGMTGGANTYWVVCANLENVEHGNYYCRSNAQ